MKHILIEDYDYHLDESRIAAYPLDERDSSKLLLSIGDKITEDRFSNLSAWLSAGDVLVFNDSKVVKARLHMKKDTGAIIEVFCLEPFLPIDFERNFSSNGPVRWKCMIGNLRKWKKGLISTDFLHKGDQCYLWANRLESSGDAWIVEFDWSNRSLTFIEVLKLAGKTPIPPYLNRKDESIDVERYQTIYCNKDGSVAAPTAGLHFTERVLNKLETGKIAKASITLHVSAGTFKPVKSINITDHEMHTEHFYLTPENLDRIRTGRIIAVGTTSLRTLESVYWIGVSLIEGRFNPAHVPSVGQWEPYRPHRRITTDEAFDAVGDYMHSRPGHLLEAKTSLIIVPGYRFRIAKGLITNFHQPKSTLLLLVAAFAGSRWKDIYDYALNNDFRFLSYGDSSLIIPSP
ncbi:MAG: S-adenosylmethionine:tRNA ribosyltransferase-isomerase [Bacteroidales bacterium]|jgi:S-adenosylmethionine:tRNA ribosyltransferase-isomerase|nr:S-adenosylmethionine:tRNA ribosyltransferase-isomerase [Bacteroidales bacterium]